MKPEPLNEKKILYTAPVMTDGSDHERNFVTKELYDKLKTRDDEPLLKLKDVNSAVEWLKEQITPQMTAYRFKTMIDEAFQDLKEK